MKASSSGKIEIAIAHEKKTMRCVVWTLVRREVSHFALIRALVVLTTLQFNLLNRSKWSFIFCRALIVHENALFSHHINSTLYSLFSCVHTSFKRQQRRLWWRVKMRENFHTEKLFASCVEFPSIWIAKLFSHENLFISWQLTRTKCRSHCQFSRCFSPHSISRSLFLSLHVALN